jgi:hypothetical protein
MNNINMEHMRTAFHIKQAQTALRMLQSNIVYALGKDGGEQYAEQIAALRAMLTTHLAKLDNITLTTGNKT